MEGFVKKSNKGPLIREKGALFSLFWGYFAVFHKNPDQSLGERLVPNRNSDTSNGDHQPLIWVLGDPQG